MLISIRSAFPCYILKKRAQQPTDRDREIYGQIKKCVFLGVDIESGTFLPNWYAVSNYHLNRLLDLDLNHPVKNGLFDDAPPQQYVPARSL